MLKRKPGFIVEIWLYVAGAAAAVAAFSWLGGDSEKAAVLTLIAGAAVLLNRILLKRVPFKWYR